MYKVIFFLYCIVLSFACFVFRLKQLVGIHKQVYYYMLNDFSVIINVAQLPVATKGFKTLICDDIKNIIFSLCDDYDWRKTFGIASHFHDFC